MANQTLKFEDFEENKLSKNQQKTVRGGDGEIDGDTSNPGKTKGGNG